MADSSHHNTTKLTLSCACRGITGSVYVPTSTLPLPLVLCHCDTCRHTSGLLCASDVFIPSGSSKLEIQGVPRRYKSSSHLTRFFCGRCGCFIYDWNEQTAAVGICSGALEKADGLVELSQHYFVGDTIDGGLSVWLPNVVRWKGSPRESDRIESEMKKESVNTSKILEASARLRGHCHCRGVQFDITRPDQNSLKPSSPWSDNLVPYHAGSSENSDDVKWWLRANGTKYLAGTCACNSCRLGSGYDIQAWAFVPRGNIFQVNGEGLDFSMGTLKRYESSRGAYRDFCGNCGANVFWHSDARAELIDISAGLLDAESGTRAAEWLEWWTERISFGEMALNKGLISQLSNGLRDWGKAEREDG